MGGCLNFTAKLLSDMTLSDENEETGYGRRHSWDLVGRGYPHLLEFVPTLALR
jgi:hypothetical protein